MNQAEKDRADKSKRLIVETFAEAYDDLLREQAQEAGPRLLNKLITMADGTQFERAEDGSIKRDEDMRPLVDGERISPQLQRGAIKDVLDRADTPQDNPTAPGGSGGTQIGTANFYLTEILYADKKDTSESVLAGATIVEAIDKEAAAQATVVAQATDDDEEE